MPAPSASWPPRPDWLSDALTPKPARAAGRRRRQDLPFVEVLAWRGGLPSSAAGVVEAIRADAVSGLLCQTVGRPDLRVVRDLATGAVLVDICDVDDAVVGPWEWDVRIAALDLAGGAPHSAAALDDVEEFGRSYRTTIRRMAQAGQPRWRPTVAQARATYRELVRGSRGEGVVAGIPVWERECALAMFRRGDLPDDAVAADAVEVRRWFAEYRENLPEAAGLRLGEVEIVEAVHVGASTLVLGAGPATHLLWQVRTARPSVWGQADSGSDAQRLLLAADLVSAVVDPLAGWCSDARRLGSLVWGSALAPSAPRGRRGARAAALLERAPHWWRRRCARALGVTLARAHASTVDLAALAGYLGGSPAFDERLAASSARARLALEPQALDLGSDHEADRA